MNTHLRHARSFYDTHFELMKQRLLAAGIRTFATARWTRTAALFERDRAERFRELGEAGIRVTFIFRPMVTREFVQEFPERVRPAFEAFELPNELNQQKALPWAETLRIWMPMFAHTSATIRRWRVIRSSVRRSPISAAIRISARRSAAGRGLRQSPQVLPRVQSRRPRVTAAAARRLATRGITARCPTRCARCAASPATSPSCAPRRVT